MNNTDIHKYSDQTRMVWWIFLEFVEALCIYRSHQSSWWFTSTVLLVHWWFNYASHPFHDRIGKTCWTLCTHTGGLHDTNFGTGELELVKWRGTPTHQSFCTPPSVERSGWKSGLESWQANGQLWVVVWYPSFDERPLLHPTIITVFQIICVSTASI